MASIAKRPDGNYRARYRGPDGNEHAKHFARKVDAQRWLDEQTAAMVTGQYVNPRAGRVTFRQRGDQWRTTAPHGPTTAYLVERALEKRVYPEIGDIPIGAIRTTQVQALVTGWGATLAPSSVRVMYGYVVSVFAAAVRDKVIAVSPCDGVRLPPARRKQVEIPPLSVLDVLRDALPPRLRAVVDLVAGSGLRQGEVFGLEVNGLDFLRTRAVDVHQQLVTLPKQVYLGRVKTAESQRVVPLAAVTLEVLAAHLAAFPVRPVPITDRTDPHKPAQREAQLVFTLDDGRPVSRHAWAYLWHPAARAAELAPRTGLHALRHQYASLLIRHGESVKTVQKRMGHSSAAITLDTYSHLWPDADDRTREAVQRALGGGSADSLRTGEGPS
jgi:integrase